MFWQVSYSMQSEILEIKLSRYTESVDSSQQIREYDIRIHRFTHSAVKKIKTKHKLIKYYFVKMNRKKSLEHENGNFMYKALYFPP